MKAEAGDPHLFFPRLFLSLHILSSLLLCLCLQACAGSRPSSAELPRPNPGFLHWVEKDSMLSQAPPLISAVSQTERIWLNNSKEDRTAILLEAAPNWINVSPRAPVFRSLVPALSSYADLGIQGIYLGQTGEKDTIWIGDREEWGVASGLRFDEASFGSESDYDQLIMASESRDMQLGSDLLPAATGLGPDFSLVARNAPGRSGLYAMLPVPAEFWSVLPPEEPQGAASELVGCPLEAEAVEELASAGLIPQTMGQDQIPWLADTGWAATGSVNGMDGIARRWIYRYAGSVSHPILLWQDPGGLARMLFSAAVIRQTGLLGQSLLGISVAPLFGLEPAATEEPEAPLEPGLQALYDISAQIHRYGGWALLIDPVPAPVLERALRGAVDYCVDEVTPQLVLYGIQNSDPAPLCDLYQTWLNNHLPVHRLARGAFNTARTARPLLPDGVGSAAQTSESLVSSVPSSFYLNWRIGLPGLLFLDEGEATPELALVLRARRATGLASAQLAGVFRQGKVCGILSRLPDGHYWLLAANFSSKSGQLEVRLPVVPHSARDISDNSAMEVAGRKIVIPLDGYQSRNVVIYQTIRAGSEAHADTE